MAKLIALEWDAREARIAVANSRGNEVVVEQAFAVELSSTGDAPSHAEVGKLLADVFARHSLTGSDALVALPRSSIELRTLSLPLAPPEEIPDLVRFQAMQAFTSIGEDWPLDYVELDAHEESLNVLAAVVSPKQVEQIQSVCAASELQTRCLVLRPFAAVSLLRRCDSMDVFRGSLIVDLLPDGVDLTAVSKGQVVFMRSVRLPAQGDAQAQAKALVGELRRTIGAAQNQMGGGSIEQIIICGGEAEHKVLHQTVSDALTLDVVSFDPFEAVRVARPLKSNMPDNAGRFAPLLGMLTCHVTGTGHLLDFLNPRKRPKPPSTKRRNLALAAAVVAVAAVGAFLILYQKSKMDSEIAALREQSMLLTEAVDKAKQLTQKADAVKEFTDGDITWLDEIREIATRLPDADHVILHEVSLGAHMERGGFMTLKGNVVTSDVIAEFEESLRYGENVVTGRLGTIDRTSRDYPYALDTTIVVPPDIQENGRSLGRPKLPPDTSAETLAKPADSGETELAGEAPQIESPTDATTESVSANSDAVTEPAETGKPETNASPVESAEPAGDAEPAAAGDASPAVENATPQTPPATPETPVKTNSEEPQRADQAGSQTS